MLALSGAADVAGVDSAELADSAFVGERDDVGYKQCTQCSTIIVEQPT
jgi:hypothetical protein